MNQRSLEFFVAVAEESSFTRAAERLLVAQPAVSQRVRDLEVVLGQRLLSRTSRRVELTQAGAHLLALARPLLAALNDLDEQMASFKGEVVGELSVASIKALPGIQLSSLVHAFRRKHPSVKLILRELTTSTMLDELADGTIDLAIVQAPARRPDGIAFEELASDTLVLIAPLEHPLGERESVTMSDLVSEQFVALVRKSGLHESLLTAAAKAGFEPRIVVEALQLDTIRELVSAGLGVSIVPRSRAMSVGPPVSVVPIGPPLLVRRIVIASRENTLSPGATAFKDIAIRAFQRSTALGSRLKS